MSEHLSAAELEEARMEERTTIDRGNVTCDRNLFRKLIAAASECAQLRAALAGNDDGRVFFEVMSECTGYKAECERLRAALSDLVDAQNGPPILKKSWCDGWNKAMTAAYELLGRRPWQYKDR